MMMMFECLTAWFIDRIFMEAKLKSKQSKVTAQLWWSWDSSAVCVVVQKMTQEHLKNKGTEDNWIKYAVRAKLNTCFD